MVRDYLSSVAHNEHVVSVRKCDSTKAVYWLITDTKSRLLLHFAQTAVITCQSTPLVPCVLCLNWQVWVLTTPQFSSYIECKTALMFIQFNFMTFCLPGDLIPSNLPSCFNYKNAINYYNITHKELHERIILPEISFFPKTPDSNLYNKTAT